MSPAGKPLLVTSIFAPSAWNRHWYELQKRYLQDTTDLDYDYGVALNGIEASGFDAGDILFSNQDNEGHSHALTQLLHYFRKLSYENYLILDSDAFPIQHGWHGILTAQMEKFDKSIAAPIRTENLDLFPHPSIFFMRRKVLDDPVLDFHIRSGGGNLLGDNAPDVGGAMQARPDVLPLIRTNTINLHPVACGIYNHLFYHHGAGSRGFQFRVSEDYAYHEHWLENSDREQQSRYLFDALVRDPDGFIRRLTDLPEPPAPEPETTATGSGNPGFLARLFGGRQ